MNPLKPKHWLPLAAALSLLAGVTAFAWRCRVQTTLILVRHADRAGNDDALTPAGLARASELARVAAKLMPAAVFHSNTQRARDTAAPLARALGLSPLERPAGDTDGLLAEILEQYRGQRVLVVGHGNTLPQIIRAAGGPSLPDLAHDEFDDLFVLGVCGCWPRRAEVAHLQYGAVSP